MRPNAAIGDTHRRTGNTQIGRLHRTIDRTSDGFAAAVLWLEKGLDAALPHSQLWRAIVICVPVLACFVAMVGLSLRASNPYDFPAYFMAALSFLHGRPVYGLSLEHLPALAKSLGIGSYGTPYFYPPLTAVLVVPLTLLPFTVAAWVWGLINGLAILGGTALLLGERRWQRKSLVVWLTIALFVPGLTSLYAGQVGGLLYFAIAAAIAAHGAGRPVLAGMAVALAVLLKITPLALVAYLLWRGDWKALLGVLIGLVFLVILTLPVAGLSGWIDFFTIGLGTFHTPDAVAYPANITLNGILRLWLTPNDWTQPFINVAPLVTPLWLGSAFAVVALTIAACGPPLRNRTGVQFEFALVMLATQFLPPFTFYHQLTSTLLPACVLLLAAWRAGQLRAAWLAGVAALVVLIDLFGVGWHRIENNNVLLALPLASLLILWAALAIKVRRDSAAASRSAVS